MSEIANEKKGSPLIKVLRRRNFRLLWIGEGISLLGDQFYMIALPWLVLKMTGDALAVGGVLAIAGIPRALFMLVGGALTDRFSPRKVILWSYLLRMVVVILLTLLVMGTANGYVSILFITWLQSRTPQFMLGRLMSLLMFAALGLNPISMALSGVFIGLNATATFVGAGSLMTAIVLLTALNPEVREMRMEFVEDG